jgi:hypothetical protein
MFLISPMPPAALEYLAKAKRCEQRARTTRNPENPGGQLILARPYRALAEEETTSPGGVCRSLPSGRLPADPQ